MRVTRHLWVAVSQGSQVMRMSPIALAVFFTKEAAQIWARSNYPVQPKIVKVPIPGWWSK